MVGQDAILASQNAIWPARTPFWLARMQYWKIKEPFWGRQTVVLASENVILASQDAIWFTKTCYGSKIILTRLASERDAISAGQNSTPVSLVRQSTRKDNLKNIRHRIDTPCPTSLVNRSLSMYIDRYTLVYIYIYIYMAAGLLSFVPRIVMKRSPPERWEVVNRQGINRFCD